MYNYFINFQPVLLGASLPLGALRVRLVRLWVNLALVKDHYRHTGGRRRCAPEYEIPILGPRAGSGAVSKWVIRACDSLVDFGAV